MSNAKIAPEPRKRKAGARKPKRLVDVAATRRPADVSLPIVVFQGKDRPDKRATGRGGARVPLWGSAWYWEPGDFERICGREIAWGSPYPSERAAREAGDDDRAKWIALREERARADDPSSNVIDLAVFRASKKRRK